MEQNSQHCLDLEKDRYQINKLICVNSMKNICYIELDVTQNTVLYGENNLGKTSILSTLKLHLLPEINFRDSKNKFAFLGSSGKAYNNQESRDYYFPSINSFLILEGQNPFGPYVYILFRASEEQFGYSRMVLPVSYAEIEHEFWDKSSTINNHLGGINPNLSLKHIKSLLKQYNGRLLRSTSEIRETIYTFNQLNEDKGRFCIIPMKEGGVGREVEAFRRLLQFTFEINQGSPASLTSALATIIEGQKKSKKDELDQNLQTIIDEYNQLNEEQQKITRLKNTTDYYQRIKKHYSKAGVSLQSASEYYWLIKSDLASQQQQLLQQEQKLIPEYDLLLSDLLPDHQKKHQQLESDKKQLNKSYHQLQGLLSSEQKKLSRIKYLQQEEYSFFPHSEIQELLQDNVNDLITEIESKQSEESFALSLQDKIKLQNSLRARVKQLDAQLLNAEHSILYQVSAHSASVLSTLNPDFDQLTIDNCGQLSTEELASIDGFADLFEQKNDHLFFKQYDFIHSLTSFDPQQQQQKWREDKQRYEKRLKLVSLQIDKDQQQFKNLTAEDLALQKQQAETQLIVAKNDLSLIIDCEKITLDCQTNSQQLAEFQQQREELQNELDKSAEQLQLYKAQKHQLKEQIADFKNQKAILLRLIDQLKSYQDYEQQLESCAQANADKAELIKGANKNIVADEASVTELEQYMAAFKFSLQQTEETIHDLVFKEKLALLNTEEVYRRGKLLDEISPLVEQLSIEYENIDSYEKHLQLLVKKHNKIVGTKVSELEQNYQLINDFRHKLNHSFSHISISDLEEIHIKLRLDPRFEELLSDIKSQSVDFYNDSLISADFYDKLNTFCGQFFVSKQGKSESLTLEGLIKEVLYEFRIKGLSQRTTASQSNGTNAIINSTFLTILLNELIQSNIILALPIVFDEIANLDHHNMISVVDVAKQNHFSLFSATPTENLQLNSVLGNFIDLDLFKAVDQSYNEHRDIIYYGGAERLETIVDNPIDSSTTSAERAD